MQRFHRYVYVWMLASERDTENKMSFHTVLCEPYPRQLNVSSLVSFKRWQRHLVPIQRYLFVVCSEFFRNLFRFLWCLVDALMKRSDIIQKRGRIYKNIRKLYKKNMTMIEEKKREMKAISIIYIKLLYINKYSI